MPFYAVMPRTTSAEKDRRARALWRALPFHRDGRTIYREAASLAKRLGGIFIDQFTFAERATDWRGNNNIAESIFAQMLQERHPVPTWNVMGAGTGGTSATIGRYPRYRRNATRLCVADVEHSAFFDGFRCRDAARTCDPGSLIEGVGRPRVEPSFVNGVVDRMVKVPTRHRVERAFTPARAARRRLDRHQLFRPLLAADEIRRNGESRSLVTLICDSGERYARDLLHRRMALPGLRTCSHTCDG